jgi:glycosyltransferase involved in cell wall biosynthesis
MKIAFISHGHPVESKGGTEVASHCLFNAMKEAGNDCLYIARTLKKSHPGTIFSSIAKDEILIHAPVVNPFDLSSQSMEHFNGLSLILQRFNPDVIHIHHFMNFGIEIFGILSNACPKAKIVFTVHEFLSICAHHGQMVKTGSLKLCHEEKYYDCAQCFPERTPQDFFVRKQFLQNNLAMVDRFISPSQFLADRYIKWGVEESQFSVIENVLDVSEKIPPIPLEGPFRGNFVFLGKASPFKGLDLLLEAILDLPAEYKEHFHLNVYAERLYKGLRPELKELVDQCGECVSYHGPFERNELQSIVAPNDWVIIPSIWWENSPVVIQEAISLGRPVVGSNIGGMKEKIEGKAGLTFPVGNKFELTKTLIQAMNPKCFDLWQSKLKKSDSIEEHSKLYQNLVRVKKEIRIPAANG